MFTSAAEAHERDPRAYPYGYLTGGSDELKSVRVFVWFRTMDELIDSLLDVEPRMYGVEPKRGLEAYQARVRPILERLKAAGIRRDLAGGIRAADRRQVRRRLVGHLLGAARRARCPRRRADRGFLGPDRRRQLLPSGEDTAFIDFLRPPAD